MTDFRIYQLDISNNNVFRSFRGKVRMDDYNLVWREFGVPCKGLEELYVRFNTNHPKDFKGHSMSVSDVIEIVNSDTIETGFYFCDDIGFHKLTKDEIK